MRIFTKLKNLKLKKSDSGNAAVFGSFLTFLRFWQQFST